MAGQFGHQSARILTVEPPVDFAFQFGGGNGASPVAVAVPEGIDALNFAEHSRTDHLDRFQVDRIVEPLLVDKEDMIGPLVGLVHV